MLECEIEKKVCDHAIDRGWLTYKFASPARRSVPDRLMVPPEGRGDMFFIEFKSPGKELTPSQDRERTRLKENGREVFLIDNADEGIRLIDKYK